MPEAATIRPYGANDEVGLLAVWNEGMWADPIDERAWRARYLLDPNFSPSTCLVAVDPGDDRIVGFLLCMRRPESTATETWVVGFGVRTASRRLGIGTAMFAALEAEMSAAGMQRLVVGPWIPHYVTPGVDVAAYAGAIPFLESLGGVVESRPLSMKMSLTGYRPAPGVEETRQRLAQQGVVIRPVTAADLLPLLSFLESDFPHWRGDAAGVLAEQFGGDPAQTTIYIAVENGRIIGYAQSRGERFGPFGVGESQRGRGVGAVLLATTLQAMRARGYHCAWFLWTSDQAAKLYRRHGFEEVRRFALMSVKLQKEK